MVKLRKIIESDIADYVKWTQTDTEWQNWDAPWEVWSKVDTDEFVEMRKLDITSTPEIYGRLEIEADGRHIGWVSRYDMSCEDFNGKTAIGIDIPPQDVRGKGYGKAAMVAWMSYLFEKMNIDAIYTQTWSGNLPMTALADRLGFAEVRRIKGLREVRGQKYDALTFSISKKDFCKQNNR